MEQIQERLLWLSPFVGSLDWVDVGHQFMGDAAENWAGWSISSKNGNYAVSAPLYEPSLGQIDIGAVYYIDQNQMNSFVSGGNIQSTLAQSNVILREHRHLNNLAMMF